MSHGLICTKLGMSRVFSPEGAAIAVTYLKAEPNIVVRLKTREKDGYNAVILGLGTKHWKTRKGHEMIRYKHLKEWRVEKLDGLEPGTTVSCEPFVKDGTLSITGVSKGKGFQGTVKRHGFAGGPASHGSHFKREPGSVGMREEPGRIHKGKRMAGRMGQDTVTLRERLIVESDPEKCVIAVKGPIPGPTGTPVYITLESSD